MDGELQYRYVTRFLDLHDKHQKPEPAKKPDQKDPYDNIFNRYFTPIALGLAPGIWFELTNYFAKPKIGKWESFGVSLAVAGGLYYVFNLMLNGWFFLALPLGFFPAFLCIVWKLPQLFLTVRPAPSANLHNNQASPLRPAQFSNVYFDAAPYVANPSVPPVAQLNDSRAVEPLIQVLRNDKAFQVRITAVKALVQLNDPRAVEPLIQASRKDSSHGVRAVASTEIETKRFRDIQRRRLLGVDRG